MGTGERDTCEAKCGEVGTQDVKVGQDGSLGVRKKLRAGRRVHEGRERSTDYRGWLERKGGSV